LELPCSLRLRDRDREVAAFVLDVGAMSLDATRELEAASRACCREPDAHRAWR
jgi:hypothetical protein